MSDYTKSLEFWDKMFGQTDGQYQPYESFLSNKTFIGIASEYIKKNGKVLDFGCGTGWGLFELNFITNIKEGIGIDASKNGVDIANKIKEISGYKNINFIQGDENLLDKYPSYFDFVLSVNTLDVVPDEKVKNMIDKFALTLKRNGTLMLCLNHDFTEDELVNLLKMEKRNGLYYKDDILRGNIKPKNEWIKLFRDKFEFVKYCHFYLTDVEKRFKRQMFIFKKK